MTVYATIRHLHRGGMIPFLVEIFGEFEDSLWAVLNTISTTLATVHDYVNNPSGNLNLIHIEWNPPKTHNPFLAFV
jgi:hypothetical protein